jgi:uncharacterized protein (DUF924 family)
MLAPTNLHETLSMSLTRILTLATVIATSACVDRASRTDLGANMTTAVLAETVSNVSTATRRAALDIVAFWREAGPSMWFAKDDAFDRDFRDRFLDLHEAAARGELAAWENTSEGALALLILLDQFPRNAFRGTARMYATDATARAVADRAIVAGLDRAIEPQLRTFVYLPFAHSESLADQEHSVALNRTLGDDNLSHAQHHHDIVARFGRFPHRNLILGRAMRPEEQKYLDNGGYRG